MSSLTLHNLDPELADALKARALERHSSLNKTVQGLLKEALGLEKASGKKSDFSDLAGTWSIEDAQAFEETTAEFSQIDAELWK